MTSTLLKYHVAPKLESILDKESKITHEMLSAQIETRLGSGEGSSAKGPDMKVWSKGKGLENVSHQFFRAQPMLIYLSRWIGPQWSSVTLQLSYPSHRNPVTT